MTINFESIIPFGMIVRATDPNTMLDAIPIQDLRRLIHAHHLVVLRGFSSPNHQENFVKYSEQWGEISIWPFGKVLDLVQHQNPNDHIFDHTHVPMHWDGMYRSHVPELQIFQCIQATPPDHGGETLFANTKKILEESPSDIREIWKRVSVTYERRTDFYTSKTTAPIITTHPMGGYHVMRYCEPPDTTDTKFLNHPMISFQGLGSVTSEVFQKTLKTALYARENLYAHVWQKGDVLIADNETLLHGRKAFTRGAPRHLQRVQILPAIAAENPHLVSIQ
jgi:alpha-ketoglutarate-dependent taurine dioxygenase